MGRRARVTILETFGPTTYRRLVLALAATLLALLVQPVHGQQACPCSLWTLSTTPGALEPDPSAIELGVKFRADADGYVTGVRFYKYAQNTGPHTGNLWTSGGTLLGSVTFAGETASGWQEATFATPIPVTANTTYVASYFTPTGHYAVTAPGFTTGVDNAPLHAPASAAVGGNGVYRYGATSGFPANSWQAANFWVDVVFVPTVTVDTTPPVITTTSPANGATAVSPATPVRATFSESISPATATTGTVTLRDASQIPVPATVATSGPVVTLTPSAPLANGTTYTATVAGGPGGVTDLAGNALAADFVWSFTTAAGGSGCPCSIWGQAAPPSLLANDAASVELGVKFRADAGGYITGVRFYKYAQNTGTHVGNLWTSTGTLLGTVTFSGETSSGWQEAIFATPIPITANTTYVASYFAPAGFYAYTQPGFTNAVDNAPLHALADAAGGGNGVYRYGAASGFPTSTWQATNYWVDVVFTTTLPDTTPPIVTMTAPPDGTTVEGSAVTVSATATDDVGVAGVQFLLDGQPLGNELSNPPYGLAWNSLTTPNGAHVLAARARDAAGNLTTSNPVNVIVSNAAPSPSIDTIASGDRSSRSRTVVTGAFSTSSGGELLLAFIAGDNPFSGSVTVSSVAGANLTWQLVARTNVQRGTAEVWRAFAAGVLTNAMVTATFSQSVASSITVVAFTGADPSGSNGAGAIGATASANASSGAPTASLTTTRGGSWVFGVGSDWEESIARTVGPGQAMVHEFLSLRGTFWVQRRNAPTPSAGTLVTINDTAPTGDAYNLTLVEVLPALPSGADSTPPSVTSVTPPGGATAVSPAAIVKAVFSEPINPATIGGSTVELRSSSGALVASVVSYDAAANTAILAPQMALTGGASYTATVTTGVTDLAGNALASPVSWTFTVAPPAPSPTAGGGGPILVVTNPGNPFTQYYAEILRAEGLNEFTVLDISQVTPTSLAAFDVTILGEQPLTTSQVAVLTNWVQGGGQLIALRPDKDLAALLGLVDDNVTVSNGYLLIDTSGAPGAGLVNEVIQFHGPIDLYVTAGASVLATLYSGATQATVFPAVTLHSVGSSGGQAAAFTYDLAKSVIYTRQGNPAWAADERDGIAPVRSDDLFYGAKAGDFQLDWVDPARIGIPQADEQQRLLANLILFMNSARRPLPRFWYFPHGHKAVIVMTGDDHGNGGTAGRMNQYLALSAPGCDVDAWECIRSSSYIYPNTPIADFQVADFVAQGFDIGAHIHLASGQYECGQNYTASTLPGTYTSELSLFAAAFPSAPSPTTNRTHCVMWSDWSSQAEVEYQHGIRLDTNYYYWPPWWVNDVPGFFTGSGMPMRFARTNGSMIDVYQAATQMTDESEQSYPATVDALLDNALGPPGYYGAFTANMHTDFAPSDASDAIVFSALVRGVPIVSAKQMLTWLDGRNSSIFGPITWTGSVLTFSVAPGVGSQGLQVMVPVRAGSLQLTGITLSGTPASFTIQTIKGLQYAFVTVNSGEYAATYAP